jgi:hypothetical protein
VSAREREKQRETERGEGRVGERYLTFKREGQLGLRPTKAVVNDTGQHIHSLQKSCEVLIFHFISANKYKASYLFVLTLDFGL